MTCGFAEATFARTGAGECWFGPQPKPLSWIKPVLVPGHEICTGSWPCALQVLEGVSCSKHIGVPVPGMS
jgi:hypothetical protein